MARSSTALLVAMGRHKKSKKASIANGALAKNKGKATATVPVLECVMQSDGGFTISTEQRPKLPKGCVAYASEFNTFRACIAESSEFREENPKDKSCRAPAKRAALSTAVRKKALEMAEAAKRTDLASKLSSLKALTNGSPVPFVYPPDQLPRTHTRGARAARAPRSAR